MTAVTQPATLGHILLPSTRDELLKIEGGAPSEFLVKLGDPAEPASVESVLAHLQSSSIVHIASHGIQYMNRPLDSTNILEDGQELKIFRTSNHGTFHAKRSLAFLSACETAAANENLPQESIHIGASLLFFGFRGVVVTMWVRDPVRMIVECDPIRVL
jgi:CHAT domain-containing protein